MSTLSFRKSVQKVLRENQDNSDASFIIYTMLRDEGFKVKIGWSKSILEPMVMSVRERNFGDPRAEAIELCKAMVVDLNIDLVNRGLVSSDEKVMAKIENATKDRPSFNMRRG